MKNLIIGTANFGKNYGLLNQGNFIDNNIANTILDFSLDKGISKIDTAPVYGNSQKIIGNYGANHFNIFSKISKFSASDKDIGATIELEIKKNLKDLKISKINNILFHDSETMLSKKGNEVYKVISNFKKLGIIGKIGFSVYSPTVIPKLLDFFDFDIIQAPLNVFDRRLLSSDYVNLLSKKKCRLILRSIFLQGLLLAEMKRIPKNFIKWKKLLKDWDLWVKSQKISKVQACIGFLNSLKFDKDILIGVANLQQLKEICDNYNFKLDVPEQFTVNDEKLIDPFRW